MNQGLNREGQGATFEFEVRIAELADSLLRLDNPTFELLTAEYRDKKDDKKYSKRFEKEDKLFCLVDRKEQLPSCLTNISEDDYSKLHCIANSIAKMQLLFP